MFVTGSFSDLRNRWRFINGPTRLQLCSGAKPSSLTSGLLRMSFGMTIEGGRKVFEKGLNGKYLWILCIPKVPRSLKLFLHWQGIWLRPNTIPSLFRRPFCWGRILLVGSIGPSLYRSESVMTISHFWICLYGRSNREGLLSSPHTKKVDNTTQNKTKLVQYYL